MNNNAKSTPKHGPGVNMNAPERAKDFKGAIKRLVKELDRYKVLVIVAFVLAILGSVISILAPDKLSELTDEISEGLVINQENMEKLKELSEKIKDRDIGIEEAVSCYEEGMKYYRSCEEILKNAKQKMEKFEGEV